MSFIPRRVLWRAIVPSLAAILAVVVGCTLLVTRCASLRGCVAAMEA